MGGRVDGSLYYYAPNKGGPVAFAVLFAASGFFHFYQTMRYRSFRTTALMPWAALLLTAGFILREVGAFNYSNVDLFIAENVLIMSGPPVYAAINYIVLSRILFYVPYLSPIHPGRVLTTFLAADAVCEILIVNGVQRLVNSRFNERNRQIGGDLTKAGLILQAVLFVLFVLLAVVFHLRAIKAGVMRPNIRTVLIVLYISCTIITARCIYRIVEFFEWGDGPLAHQEAYFWIFEATIMFINTAMLNIWHPGKYLPRSNKNFLARDGETVLRGPGWEDKRPFIVTFFDPFDLWGLATGRDKKTRFWDMDPAKLAALDAENRKKREEKLARGRPAWAKVLDPLHLFGSQGGIVAAAKKLEKDSTPQQSGVEVETSTVKTKREESV